MMIILVARKLYKVNRVVSCCKLVLPIVCELRGLFVSFLK